MTDFGFTRESLMTEEIMEIFWREGSPIRKLESREYNRVFEHVHKIVRREFLNPIANGRSRDD